MIRVRQRRQYGHHADQGALRIHHISLGSMGGPQVRHELFPCHALGRRLHRLDVEIGQGLIYFRKAADKGLTESRYMIALSYFEGEGQIQNRRLAYEGFRETAIEGYADSQYMLSFMLLDGNDVKRRSAQAYVWAALALIQGQQQAQEIRDAAAMRIDEKETSDALFVLSQCESSGVRGCLLSLDSLP